MTTTPNDGYCTHHCEGVGVMHPYHGVGNPPVVRGGTVDPNREIPAYEVRTLVTIEVAERLMRKALEALQAGDTERASMLLEEATTATTNTTCTHVKKQALSDQISEAARTRVAQMVGLVEDLLRVKAEERAEQAGLPPHREPGHSHDTTEECKPENCTGHPHWEEIRWAKVHKATPSRDGATHCIWCGQRVHKVPGGSGPTWVHTDSGAVAAPNPPKEDLLRYADGCVGTHNPETNPVCAEHLKPKEG